MEKSFDKAQLSHLDVNLREMIDKSYDLCIYRCNENRDTRMMPCKQDCFRKIQVPYRRANHIARDQEENSYRLCLSQKESFPAL